MRKKYSALLLSLLIVLSSCGTSPTRTPEPTPDLVDYGYKRTVKPSEYTDIRYNEWDITAAVSATEKQPLRRHTLMIYMNGSDLESDTGAATRDIRELTKAEIDTAQLNIVLFTGGANRWGNNAIPADECVISRIAGGKLSEIAGVGQRNMGDAGTLSSFVKYCADAFPADAFSLVLWDHGGGTIAGYGDDEHFRDGNLTLRELEYAFSKAELAEKPLELLGFDACLMASVETAVVASPFAHCLVASESLEPHNGWDYSVFRKLGKHPDMPPEELGHAIADAFLNSGGAFPREEYTLSVIALNEVENVMGALGLLAAQCETKLSDAAGFKKIADARAETRSFGDGEPDNPAADMVDILDLAARLDMTFPKESRAVRNALTRAVVYSRSNADKPLGGLSCYHIFGKNTESAQALAVYRDLGMIGAYTHYLEAFAAKLYGEDYKHAEVATVSATVGGVKTQMYEIGEPKGGVLYAASATVNGADCELVIYFDDGAKHGHALGYRRRDGWLIQKGCDKFKKDDKVAVNGTEVKIEGEDSTVGVDL
ncbi:MAG: hypothetical protein LBN02_03125 [Oscillospiraceae bacterium]|jgi:hypothetical protein|nr:hypothetical protein [Oscillospiraceae bacterium]